MLVKYTEIWKKEGAKKRRREIWVGGINKSVKLIILKVLQLALNKVVQGFEFQSFL